MGKIKRALYSPDFLSIILRDIINLLRLRLEDPTSQRYWLALNLLQYLDDCNALDQDFCGTSGQPLMEAAYGEVKKFRDFQDVNFLRAAVRQLEILQAAVDEARYQERHDRL